MKTLLIFIIILFSGCPIGPILFANHTIAVGWPIEDRFFKCTVSNPNHRIDSLFEDEILEPPEDIENLMMDEIEIILPDTLNLQKYSGIHLFKEKENPILYYRYKKNENEYDYVIVGKLLDETHINWCIGYPYKLDKLFKKISKEISKEISKSASVSKSVSVSKQKKILKLKIGKMKLKKDSKKIKFKFNKPKRKPKRKPKIKFNFNK